MKIALAIWEGRIAPLLDVATEIVVIDVGDSYWSEAFRLVVEPDAPRRLADTVLESGARVLLCGAASRCFADEVRGEGLQVVAFLSGAVDSIADAWAQGGFDPDRFAMPGCGRGQGRRLGCGRGRAARGG